MLYVLCFTGERSFEQFFESYRPVAFKTALRILKNRDDAEDIVQQVFLKAWHSPAAFRGGNVESWLVTLARHRAIDHLRKRRREREHCSLQGLAFGDAGEIAAALSGVLDLQSALEILPPRQREAVVTCFFWGLTHSEAALELELPVGTVKTRVRAALLRLRLANLL